DPLADGEVAEQAVVRARIVGGESRLARGLADERHGLARDRRRDVAAREIERAVEESAHVEPEREPARCVLRERVLHLVPVVIELRGRNDRQGLDAESSQVLEALLDLPLLVPQLLRVVEILEPASAAGGDVLASGCDPRGRRAEDPLGARFRIAPPLLEDGGLDAIPGQGVLDEDDEAVDLGERLSAEREVLDLELEALALLHGSAGGRRRSRAYVRFRRVRARFVVGVHPRSLHQPRRVDPTRREARIALQMKCGAADQGTVDPSPRHPVPLSAYLIAICVVPVLIAAGFALVALSRHPDNESDRAAADALSSRAPAVERAIAGEGERLERLATVL